MIIGVVWFIAIGNATLAPLKNWFYISKSWFWSEWVHCFFSKFAIALQSTKGWLHKAPEHYSPQQQCSQALPTSITSLLSTHVWDCKPCHILPVGSCTVTDSLWLLWDPWNRFLSWSILRCFGAASGPQFKQWSYSAVVKLQSCFWLTTR